MKEFIKTLDAVMPLFALLSFLYLVPTGLAILWAGSGLDKGLAVFMSTSIIITLSKVMHDRQNRP